jgi:hypothetical protein
MKRWRDWALLKTSSLLPSGSFFDDRTLRLMAGPVLAMTLFGCSKEYEFVPQDPARGPGEMAGLSKALNTTFQGGASPDVQPRSVQGEPDWTTCNADCQAYCDAQPFQNPIDEAMCPFLWGAGLDTRPVDDEQACRRIYADLRGQFPSYAEIKENCLGKPIDNVAEALIESDAFVFQNQRRWADTLRYNNIAVNLERIYDADILVGKLFAGLLRFDQFVEVISAHPVFVRRYDNSRDRAEALFNIFVGRPPYDDEKADMAKLYGLWENGYFDHPELGIRLPDAFIEHRCIGELGEIDEATSGECTSVLWGFNRVVLKPDHRAINNQTWSEVLTEDEWKVLQTPGRILGTWPVVWEHAVEDVLQMYLGYDIGKSVPLVTQKLVEYVLRQSGDIRAAHYAVVTSQLYLQSSECAGTECSHQRDYPQWTYGPLRQADAEIWLDSVGNMVHSPQGACDHRLPAANQLMEDSPLGYEVVAASRWTLDFDSAELEVDDRYANLAQTLGGCPDNEVSGRFKAIGILSTATQEAFVAELCNPAGVEGEGVPIADLMPSGLDSAQLLSDELAQTITEFQVGEFFSRRAVEAELEMARTASATCAPGPCDLEIYARASCYALLSSSEMLFY